MRSSNMLPAPKIYICCVTSINLMLHIERFIMDAMHSLREVCRSSMNTTKKLLALE